jgi:hypothetical protein
MKRLLIVLLLLLVFPGVLKAKENAGRAVGLKERLSGRTFSVIRLERRDYDSTNHASLDGIVFFPAEIKYRYIRRLNDDHRLKLNIAQGQQAAVVKPKDISKYEALIRENKLFSHPLLDRSGQEALIVYCNIREKITWTKEKNGELFLEVRDPFKKEDQDSPLVDPSFNIRK